MSLSQQFPIAYNCVLKSEFWYPCTTWREEFANAIGPGRSQHRIIGMAHTCSANISVTNKSVTGNSMGLQNNWQIQLSYIWERETPKKISQQEIESKLYIAHLSMKIEQLFNLRINFELSLMKWQSSKYPQIIV